MTDKASEIITSLFSSIIINLDEITVPGTEISFLSLYIGILAFGAIIALLKLIINVGDTDYRTADTGKKQENPVINHRMMEQRNKR